MGDYTDWETVPAGKKSNSRLIQAKGMKKVDNTINATSNVLMN